MIASVLLLKSALNSFLNEILSRSFYSQISELFHSFEGFFVSHYIVILSCILFSRNNQSKPEAIVNIP